MGFFVLVASASASVPKGDACEPSPPVDPGATKTPQVAAKPCPAMSFDGSQSLERPVLEELWLVVGAVPPAPPAWSQPYSSQ